MTSTDGRWPPQLRGPGPRQLRAVTAALTAVCLGTAVWALVAGSESPAVLLLIALSASIVLVAAAYLAERRHRRHLQHLSDSRDLLQQTVRSPLSVPALLGRLCQIFDAAFAEVVVLPETPERAAAVITVCDGRTMETSAALDRELLSDVFAVIVPTSLSLVLRDGSGPEESDRLLRRRGLRDAVMAALSVEGRILGCVLVGRRRGVSRGFDDDDRRLLEALAPQLGVTVEKLRLDERINHQAFHDSLTGLANRALFADRVIHALDRRVAGGRLRAAILFIDLDDFKVVNDSLGHPCGDLLLQGVTERLRRVVRSFDTVARLGGDEFAVLVEDLAGPEEAVGVAERFLEELAATFDLQGNAVTIGASVGIAIAESASMTYDDLLREADVAMYRAKERGKATVETFDASLQSALESRVQFKTDLEHAVDAGELYVEYQPIVALGSGTMIGVEALARWDSPRRGSVEPRDFIPVAESSGLIREIGDRVLRTACAQAARWMADRPERPLLVSVNLSPRQLLHPGFAQEVAAVLRETHLSPSLLTLEITESLLVENTATTLERLRALKDLGVTLAIDDFGTGYSSLGELKFLPVDALKIPKAFVDNVATDERERAFLAGIIGLGRTLDLRLVAVGVEQDAQLQELRELHCDLAQGFHFAAALDAAGVSELLSREVGARMWDGFRRVSPPGPNPPAREGAALRRSA
ncbi:MAG: putative bifunctional diguanylate cyclase/phosphodiesterase [Candidatus Dormibacteria bacterium]